MGEDVYYCCDCCVEHVDWCDECKEGFVLETPADKAKNKHICPSCQTKTKMIKKGGHRIDV